MEEKMEEFNILKEKILNEVDKHDKVFFLNMYGNFGDSLIREGGESLLKDIKVNYIKINDNTNKYIGNWFKTLYGKNLLIVTGSGGYCEFWDSEHLIKSLALSKRFNQVIVLPSTFQREVFPIKNVTFFARDFTSLKNVKGSIFCHDMAFYIQDKEILKKYKNKSPKFKHINMFRTDKESFIKYKENDSYDLSKMGNDQSNVSEFFDFISEYEEVSTDRLHVSISCAMLNIKCNLYPNAYFKNKEIFKSSLKDRYPKIKFFESLN